MRNLPVLDRTAMGLTTTLRLRRSAGQRHALAQVEREIRASDPHVRRKYLRDFAEAFRSYESVLKPESLQQTMTTADVILVGDYHALPAAQRYAAGLAAQHGSERPLVVGLEVVFSRDQHILDEWMCGQIDEEELRERIRFDLDWGYEWQPYFELLESARRRAVRIYGLDCTPRNDLRKIVVRDRHAAVKIAEIRERHPDAQVLVFFGESHLAPNHLPELLHERRPNDRLLTLLQNIDPLYWKAAGERERVEAVRVRDGVVCVFTATPLEKYEHYRMCLDRWRQESASPPDFAPSIYNLIEALLRFLNIDRCAPHNGTQPRFLVDLLPEVYWRASAEQLERLLTRKGATEAEMKSVLARVAHAGSCYVPAQNAILVAEWRMTPGAEEAARFVHHACRASQKELAGAEQEPSDRFYTRVLEEALAYFGSRVLCPDRPAVREADLYAVYAQPREEIAEQTSFGYREYLEIIDFLILHKDYEINQRHYHGVPLLMLAALEYRGEKFEYVTRKLGYMLGSELYDAYLAGRVAKRFLRSLFFRRLDLPGAARAVYYAIVRRTRRRK